MQSYSCNTKRTDLKMPGIDGMEVVRAAQARDPDTVCIILTGHGSLETAIEGLRRDIFDYLLKTSDPQEVLRRVREAVEQRDQIRRRKHMLQTLVSTATELGLPQRETVQPAPPLAEAQTSSQAEGSIIVGPLTIDPLRQEVTLEGRRVVLTPTEMRVLVCLARRAGTMLSYVELVQCVQGYDTFPAEAAELIKPHMHHLRQKLEPNAARPRFLLNVRGMGYLLSIDAEQAGR
jgi:DNA-binding response OmpR family regulator